MYACICKQVTDKEYRENPEARKLCGTGCGKCLEWIDLNKHSNTKYLHIEYEKFRKKRKLKVLSRYLRLLLNRYNC